jgi:hypothetical protein
VIDIRKLGKFTHANLIVVRSVVAVNRQRQPVDPRLSLDLRAGADIGLVSRESVDRPLPITVFRRGGSDVRLRR